MTRLLSLALATALLGQPALGVAQDARTAEATAHAAARPPTSGYPHLSLRKELAASAVGVGFLTWAALSISEPPPVPTGGFDPDGIRWGADRDVIGNVDVHANDLSDWTQRMALGFPLAVMFFTADPDARWSEIGARSVVYTQTMATSLGLTLVGKNLWGRARPFAYLPLEERPNEPAYDVTRSRAFRSAPSAHSSSTWPEVRRAMTEHLMLRPDADAWERLGLGFVGGALAGATGALRVTAGQHFPSDVLAGAGLGVSTGVVLPLIHRGSTPMPPPRAWLEMFGAALGGALVGAWAGS